MAALSVGLPRRLKSRITVGVRPQVHGSTDELGAVVAVDAFRQTPLEAQPLECGDHVTAAQALAHVDRQALAREEIEHGEGTEPPPVGELIGHEVHTPDVIPCGRGSSLLTVHGRGVAPWALPPERQSLLGVEAITALLAEFPAFRRNSTRSRR